MVTLTSCLGHTSHCLPPAPKASSPGISSLLWSQQISEPTTSATPGTSKRNALSSSHQFPRTETSRTHGWKPKASLHTHPTLLLPRDDDPLKFPFQYHITFPKTPVTLSLSLLLVQPIGKRDKKKRVRGSHSADPFPYHLRMPRCPPYCKSESLSVFRKSCLARSRISGSSLRVGGGRSGRARAAAAALRSQRCASFCPHTYCHMWSTGRPVGPGLFSPHFRDEKTTSEISYRVDSEPTGRWSLP